MDCGRLTLINCTLADNVGNLDGFGNGGGIVNDDPHDVVAYNCILWDNFPGQIIGVADVTYSDVQGGWGDPGDMNIDEDPLFVDPTSGNYRLKACSPCIDKANPDDTVIPCDEFDLDGDGFTCPPGPEEPTPDLDLNDRILPAPPAGIVDMGAYEHVPDPCPWDLNGDGVVDHADLVILLTNWGTDPGGPPDFNCDGTVGHADLVALLTNWGPCPESGGGDGGGGGSGSDEALEAAVMQLGFENVAACQTWLTAASDGEAFACGCILHALLAEHDD